MKVVMHAVYFPPEIGGLESHVFHLCRALAEEGHEVHVVTSRSQDGLPRQEEMEGVNVWRTWMPARNTVGWASHAFGSMPRFGGLAKDADILHAQDIAAVLPCMVAAQTTGVPFVTTYHTSHFLRRADSPFWKPIFARFLKAADHNLAASQEIADVGMGIAPGVSVEALTNGVDTARFRPTTPSLPPAEAGRPRLIVPRRLFQKNGVEIFIRAMPLLLAEVDLEAVVVGDGPERELLERLCGELGVSDHVSFLGAQPNDRMPGLLSSADLAVFPSLMEATSVAALEAMACALPVAASDVGGLPEIVDTSVGALFAPGDPAALARTVVKLLAGSDLSALGKRARERVDAQWSNARLAHRHLEVYDEVVRRRRGGAVI